MTQSATIRVMSPEEIAARAGGETPYLLWPERSRYFAEREMRLRQRAKSHAMADYLGFIAELAKVQQQALDAYPAVALPQAPLLDRAAQHLLPPLDAADWPRDPQWRSQLRLLLERLSLSAPASTQAIIERVRQADDAWLEAQADNLLAGTVQGLDLAAAPLIAAGLQVYFTHLLIEVQASAIGRGQPFGRIEDERICPCCGSRPVASVVRSAGELLGQRYLQCSLCGLQWHMVRIKCAHCLTGGSISFQSLQRVEDEPDSEAAAQAHAQAELCGGCNHYLKLFHADRDPHIDTVADDLATVTLDLLVAQSGARRHGVNLMLIFGAPEDEAEPLAVAAPSPGGPPDPPRS